jgi:hypothetical protein
MGTSGSHQELETHYQMYHLPCWLFCPQLGCEYRGDLLVEFSRHWRLHGYSQEPNEEQYVIYDVKAFINLINNGRGLATSYIHDMAVAAVKNKALQLGKPQWGKDPWGLAVKHAHTSTELR